MLFVERKLRFRSMLFFAGIVLVILLIIAGQNRNRETGVWKSAMRRELTEVLKRTLYENYMPLASEGYHPGQEGSWMIREQINSLLPFYGYLWNRAEEEEYRQELREILLAEADESDLGWETLLGETKEGGFLSEDSYPGDSQQRNLYQGDSQQGNLYQGDSQQRNLYQGDSHQGLQQEDLAQGLTLQGPLAQAGDVLTTSAFLPHEKLQELNMSKYEDYETLVKEFYTIDANTMIGSDQLDVNKLMGVDVTIDKKADAPQILIYHTHSREAFADSVPGDAATTIMGVGERLSDILTEEYGYCVLHHTGQFDVESRTVAYSSALPEITQILKENPSIQVVIDLHRDEMAEGTRLVTDLDGRPTARFMFFNGLSRTKKTGNIDYLRNEYINENLAFSFQMQKKAMEYYPGLTRKIYLKGYRYNMHLCAKSLLIELGAQNNTLEEAMNACDPLAHILNMVLTGQ